MSSATVSSISCSECGYELDPEWAHRPDRPPCPQCGATGVAIAVDIATEINIASEIEVGIGPSDPERDWAQRWNEIQTELHRIDRRYDPPPTSEAVMTANGDLFQFFVRAYHLKDALILDPSSGLLKKTVEDAVSDTPALALLADLCNLNKHYEWDPSKTPRSGGIPKPGKVFGVMPGAGGQWRLRSEIEHLGATLDGMEIARAAVEAWRQKLAGWNMI